MKTDSQLRRDVEAELQFDPAVRATDVGISVRDGLVTLTGHLTSYSERHAAEQAVLRVAGVRAVALELDVRLDAAHRRSDTDIARAARDTLRWHADVPEDRLVVLVDRGRVTLRGQVENDHQRTCAEDAVRHLTGVVDLDNALTLSPQPTPVDVAQRIRDALSRQAVREADRVQIDVDGSRIVLHGAVRSWAEARAVQGAARSAPGVTEVVSRLTVAG